MIIHFTIENTREVNGVRTPCEPYAWRVLHKPGKVVTNSRGTRYEVQRDQSVRKLAD